MPETPSWLLSKDRVAAAQKSLQWLRGWVTPQTVHNEFDKLQNYTIASNACASCAKQSIKCVHAKPSLLDKIKELKRRRNVRPMILMFLLQFFGIFNGSYVWDPYIVQVMNAFGTPLKPSYATVLSSGMGVIGSIFLGLTVKKLGRRPIFLTTSIVLALCCFGLSMFPRILKCLDFFHWFGCFCCFFKVCMGSYSFPLAGHRLKKRQMNRPKIPSRYAKW